MTPEEIHGQIQRRIDETQTRVGNVEQRIERVTANVENLDRNLTRLEHVGAESQKRQESLQQMHGELLNETKSVCKSVEEAKDIAMASRTIAEDLTAEVRPMVWAHREANKRKHNWGQIFVRVVAALVAAAVIAAATWFLSRTEF